MDDISIMKEPASELNRRIAARVRDLRAACGLSLDSLALQSGVSRSMISLVERGEISPTAVLLEKIAAALNVTLSSLFDPPIQKNRIPTGPISRQNDQPVWRDPGSGYIRRNISPPGTPQPMQIAEVRFPAGGRVAFDSRPRDVPIYQQVWILAGAIDITVGSDRHRLKAGDCLAMKIDGPTMFHNPAKKPARYVVVTAQSPARRQ